MPIKIHYGPPGSFKTSGALGDDFLREARAGRVIVTNVRGLNRGRVIDEFPDLPESFDVIHVDDKSEDGRQKLAKWFHWAPKGAFIFLDEVQDIWPKRWRDSDIKALDYPGGLAQATKDDRPFCWDQAFDKHRHWNWDMVLTTPSYKKVRDDVKGVADMAYKHKDLALLGWSGRYIEAAHLADDSGSSQSDYLNVQKKKVPAYVFKLYDSTATGAHSTTKSGFNLFANPRVFILLVCFLGALYMGFGRGSLPPQLGGSKPAVSPSPSPAASVPSSPVSSPVPMAGSPISYGQHSASSGQLGPFEGEGVYIAASLRIKGEWRYVVTFSGYDFTTSQIEEMGYHVFPYGSCGVKLMRGEWSRYIHCGAVPKPPAQVDTKPAPQVDKKTI